MDIKHQEEIEHIRSMMERSSRFISLSGKSGILAGIAALIAAFLSYYFIRESGADYFGNGPITFSPALLTKLAITALVTLIVALFSGIYFTIQKSKRNNLAI